jgi:hypothetical protein
MGLAAQRLQFSLTSFASLLFGLSLVVKLATTLWLKRSAGVADYSECTRPGRQTQHGQLTSRHPGYVGRDYPREWPIERPFVRMAASHTIRYQLDSPDGAAEWRSNVPGDGLVHLGAHRQPYTIALMHQLRCLDVVRAELVRGRDPATEEPSALARHCLNYIKQMVICRGDTQLEPFAHPNSVDPIVMDQVYECRDWDAVYREVKENQAEYARWLDAQKQA